MHPPAWMFETYSYKIIALYVNIKNPCLISSSMHKSLARIDLGFGQPALFFSEDKANRLLET